MKINPELLETQYPTSNVSNENISIDLSVQTKLTLLTCVIMSIITFVVVCFKTLFCCDENGRRQEQNKPSELSLSLRGVENETISTETLSSPHVSLDASIKTDQIKTIKSKSKKVPEPSNKSSDSIPSCLLNSRVFMKKSDKNIFTRIKSRDAYILKSTNDNSSNTLKSE